MEEKRKLTYEELESRALDLTKEIINHLSSRLREDCVTSPSLNEVVCKAVDLRQDIKKSKWQKKLKK